MANTSDTAMTVARNLGFQDRVNYFLMTAAVAVMAEDNTTTNHAARVAYAKLVLGGSVNMTQVAIAVATNVTIAGEGFSAPDGDLAFTVNSMFNALAGVST